MFPLWCKKIHKLKRIKPSPIPLIIKQYICLARGINNPVAIKGIPQPARKISASMTVEAAIILPLYLFFFMNLMTSVEMIRLHGNIQTALWEQGRLIALASYLKQEQGSEGTIEGMIFLDYGIKSMIIGELGEQYLEQSPLTFGSEGLRTIESSYYNNDCIDIKVTYLVSPMFQIPGWQAFRMANRYYARAWTGFCLNSITDMPQDTVYITPYGEVYHEHLDCRYLKRTIQSIQADRIAEERNENGERYIPCRFCGEEQIASTNQCLYITPEGNCYHYTVQCQTLKRTIQSIVRCEAQKSYRLCSACTKK